MQWRSPAVSDERPPREGLAPLRGMGPRRRGHVLVYDFADAERRGHGVHQERPGHVAVDRGASRRHVEPHRAAGEALRVEPPHDGVRVCHRGVGAAAAITGWAGFGAGTGRAHLNAAQLIHRGDGAAAGADFHHLHDRHTQRQAAALLEAVAAPHLERPRHQRCVVVDEADFRRGAPHVERKRLGKPQALGDAARQDGAAGRPGFDQPDGEARRGLDVRQAAAGSHHQKRAPEAARREVSRQPAQVTRHERLHVGVGASRGEAIELADFRAHLRRERHGHFRQTLREDGADALLVGRVRVGVQQADGDARHPLRLERGHQAMHRLFVEWHQHFAAGVQAFRHGVATLPGHERRRPVDVHVVLLETVLIRHFQRVAVAGRGDEGEGGAAPLDERVGRQRRAVQDDGDVLGAAPAELEHLVQAGQRTGGWRRVGGEHLRGEHLAAAVEHHVRERAADVDGDSLTGFNHCPRSASAGSRFAGSRRCPARRCHESNARRPSVAANAVERRPEPMVSRPISISPAPPTP